MSGPTIPTEILGGPDPEGGRIRFERFVEKGGVLPDDEEGRRLLSALLSSGSFLSELMLADVAGWSALAGDPWLSSSKPAEVIFAEVASATAGARDFADFKTRLRVVRRREMLRLGARELGWGTTEDVAAELSGFADACIELAYRYCDAALRAEYGTPAPMPLATAGEAKETESSTSQTSPSSGEEPGPSFVVLAMGKLGGGELNFSSDVDLIYCYATDAGQLLPPGGPANPGRRVRTLHEYYVELSRRITEAIEDATAAGFIFRVDLRLRPEGRGGPLCNSLAATERYYETFGRTWERQALLRARPCAGDKNLGDSILEVLDPFIYPRHIAPAMIDEIRALRGQFRPTREGPTDDFNVKLGGGGIRDVELVVQTLQLINGGKRRDLRGRSTPHGLRRMEIAGLLTDREARTLAAAYRFWRQVEHRLQLEEGAQTHVVPADDERRALFARRLGFADLAAFDARVVDQRTAVKEIAATFDDPEPNLPEKVLRLLSPEIERAEFQALSSELGFTDVEASGDIIESMRARLPPGLIAEAVASPDPDRALAIFRDLTLRSSDGLLSWLRDDPQLLRMLATLFGVSERLSRLLVTHPEMWAPLVDGAGEPLRSARALRSLIHDELSAGERRPVPSSDTPVAAPAPDPNAALDDREEAAARLLRRFCAEETLRIGLHDVAGNVTSGDVARQLTNLAEVCVQEGVARIVPTLSARYGLPSTSLTILGLGSLGAYEMRYGSDLDLVFLFGEDGHTSTGVGHQEFFSRLARRVINSFAAMLEEGRLYSVDTRLRPSGEQGLLVTSQRAFERYHKEDAAGWERVALLRARVVFTTASAADRVAFERTLARMTYERPFDEAAFSADMRRVRQKVEAERGKVPAGSRHLRFDPGGIMDVEFLSALGQLANGGADPGLRTTETNTALKRLIDRGWPSTLLSDYALLRRYSLRMRLLRDRPEDIVNPSDLPALARSLEEDPAKLRDDLDQAMKRVRAIFTHRFPDTPRDSAA